MESQTLADLRRKAKRNDATLLARLRERYKLAKDLGFSPAEAKLLQGRSEGYIRALAKELPGVTQ